MKNNYYIQYIKNFFKTDYFKFIICVIILNSIYGAYILYDKKTAISYVNSYISCLYSPYFIIIILLIFLVTTVKIFYLFNKNLEYMSRQNSKNDFLKNICAYSFATNLIFYLIQIIVFIFLFTLRNGVSNYNISETVFMIYYLFKIIILLYFLNKINILLLNFINKYFVFIGNLIFYFGITMSYSLILYSHNGIFIYAYIGDYLNLYLSPNILSDISSSIFYCCMLEIFLLILWKMRYIINHNARLNR